MASRSDSEPLEDHDVPMLYASLGLPQPEASSRQNRKHVVVDDDDSFEVDLNADWDPIINQLLPFIDGYNHVSKIAADAHMATSLVKSCIECLDARGVITLMPTVNIKNTYRASSNYNRLMDDRKLQEFCLKFIKKGPDSNDRPSMTDVSEVLNCLQQGASLSTVFECHAESSSQTFDIRRLVIFAQLHDVLKCHKTYPVHYADRRKILASQSNSMMGI